MEKNKHISGKFISTLFTIAFSIIINFSFSQNINCDHSIDFSTTLVDGTKKMTYSYYLPIPSKMLVDLGISRGKQQLVTVTAAYLKDGHKVVLIEKRRGPNN